MKRSKKTALPWTAAHRREARNTISQAADEVARLGGRLVRVVRVDYQAVAEVSGDGERQETMGEGR